MIPSCTAKREAHEWNDYADPDSQRGQWELCERAITLAKAIEAGEGSSSHLLGIPNVRNPSPLDPLYDAKVADFEASKPVLTAVMQAWTAIPRDTAAFPGDKNELWTRFPRAVDTHFSSRDDSPGQRQLNREICITNMICAKVEDSRRSLHDAQGSVRAPTPKQIELCSSPAASAEQEKALHDEMGTLLKAKAARQAELKRSQDELAAHQALPP